MEHEQGRNYVRGLTQAVEKYEKGDETVKRAIIENSRGYASLLSSHIPKEDNVLYPMADRTLPSSEQTELLEKFEKIEKEKIGEGRHEHYLHLVSGLEKQLGIEGSEIEYEHH
jgi:hemerythrin-like domain-containing protein